MNDEVRDAIKSYIAKVLAEAFRKKTPSEPAAQASASLKVHWSCQFLAAPTDPTSRLQDARNGISKHGELGSPKTNHGIATTTTPLTTRAPTKRIPTAERRAHPRTPRILKVTKLHADSTLSADASMEIRADSTTSGVIRSLMTIPDSSSN